jgi:hypothetical protein
MIYKVLVDDNYHYMDKDARYAHGEFETLEAAVTSAKEIVDDFLLGAYEPGMSADFLYTKYTSFGDDPWISGPSDSGLSAWVYAKARCETICACIDSRS